MLGALFACVVAMAEPIPPDLDAYVKRPDPSFAWSEKKPGQSPLHLRMTSQTWQNVRWTHDIVVAFPSEKEGIEGDQMESEGSVGQRDIGTEGQENQRESKGFESFRAASRQSEIPPEGSRRPGPPIANRKDVAILYITGGDPNKADQNEAQRLADLAKMPVAMLHHIPNQPLFGKNEDDLIAHTFEKFLETTAGSANPLKKFVVIGASKRGWTAWLAGAIQDKRVIGIAPMVFDNLRFKEQLKHQLDSWGKYSEMIADYTDKGLDKVLDTPAGTRLVDLVDPWTYRTRITIPKLIVNGSNDRYWTVDALSLYWDGLVGPKYCSIVPNAGHLLGDMKQALHAIAAFARSCAGEFEMPEIRTMIEKDDWCRVWITDSQDARYVWEAASASHDFRESKWQISGSSMGGSGSFLDYTSYKLKAKPPAAVLVQVDFHVKGMSFSLSSPVFVRK
jgi:PhoPQ-activated pathogenicity-related protein